MCKSLVQVQGFSESDVNQLLYETCSPDDSPLDLTVTSYVLLRPDYLNTYYRDLKTM